MRKKILTLDDLVKFCEESKLYSFDARETGKRLCVQMPATFEVADSDDTTLFASIQICHTGRNRNGSNLTEEAASECMSTLAYKPLLANFCEVDGVRDFTSHDMEINDDGTINYLEHQIGCFTADEPYLQDDEKVQGRKNMFGRVAIPREYTDAADIIERKNGTKVSVELEIKKMSYDAKEKELVLESAEILGCTCLGTNPETGKEVVEGMEDSHIQLEDFSFNEKPLVDEKLVEIVKATILEAFDNIQNSEKGGKPVAKKQYDVVVAPEEEVATGETTEETVETPSEEEVTEEVSEEETEAVAEETVAEETEAEAEPVVETAEEESPVVESLADLLKLSVTVNGETKEFSMSLRDKMSALYSLVNDTYSEADNAWYDVEVFEEPAYVVMQDWFSGRAYKQAYSQNENSFALEGERVEVYAEWVTAEEQQKLDTMRANYDAIAEKLAKYEAEPEKISVLSSDDYANLEGDEAFESLKEQTNHFDLSVDEIKAKLDEMLLEYAKGHKVEFSQTRKTVSMRRVIPTAPMKANGKGTYGGVFNRNK